MLVPYCMAQGHPIASPSRFAKSACCGFSSGLFLLDGFYPPALKNPHPLLTVCLIAAAGWASSKVTWLPLSIQPGAMASFFMYLGFLARKHGILDKKPLALVVALILL